MSEIQNNDGLIELPNRDSNESKNKKVYPKGVKIGAGLFTGIIIGAIWFGVAGTFYLLIKQYWSAGGHFYEWSELFIFLGWLAIIVGFILLCFTTIFLAREIYIKNRTFISKKVQAKKLGDPLKEARKTIRLLKKRNTKLFKLLATYERKKQIEVDLENV